MQHYTTNDTMLTIHADRLIKDWTLKESITPDDAREEGGRAMIANSPMPTRAQLRRVAEMTDNNNHTSARIAVASWCASAVAGDEASKALFCVFLAAFSSIQVEEMRLTHSTIELCELRYALAERLFKAMRKCGLASAARAFRNCL